jgi:photosynthetic reaction center cytochrome c subunit
MRKSSALLPTPSAARSALAVDPLSSFLLGDTPIRVAATTALPVNPPHGVQQARDTYALMEVMSESLGVNCSFCHNTRSFPTWAFSPPQRTTAWQGIRMVRDLNNNFAVPLGALLPPERRGPAGDTPKIYCGTCHFGSSKPLAGVSMLKDYPELIASKKERALMATAAASAATQP